MRFIRKHKAWFITGGVIIFLFLTALILVLTVFRTGSVSLEFHNQTRQFETAESQEEVLNSVNFYEKQSVFFMNKKKLKTELERNNPYIEIINIETIFPSTIVVHAMEREPVYAFEYGHAYLLTDAKLKVLSVISSPEGYVLMENRIGNQPAFPIGSGVKEGNFLIEEDFIDRILYQNILGLKNVFLSNSRGPGEIRSTFTCIAFELKAIAIDIDQNVIQERICLSLTDANGFNIIVFNIFDDLTGKMQFTFSILSELTPDEYAGNYLFTYRHNDGKFTAVLQPVA